METDSGVAADILSTGYDILQPVMEASVVLAGYYAASCKREVVTKEDMALGMMFAARNVTGTHVGSLYPEAYESGDDESDDSDDEREEDEEVEFTRYEGTDEKCVAMNQCADTWDEWTPTGPAEEMLKRAVDRVKEL